MNAPHPRSNGANLLPPRDRRFVVAKNLTKEEAIELEKKHIALWGRECDGGVLLNETLGGEGKPGGQKTKGFSGRKHTEESKLKTSAKVAGNLNPMFGKTHSKESKEKQRNAKLGKYDGANNPNAKSYVLTDPDGKEYVIMGNLKRFCEEVGISFATMKAAVRYNRITPRSNGWGIQKSQTSY